jgi:hypothetical protein
MLINHQNWGKYGDLHNLPIDNYGVKWHWVIQQTFTIKRQYGSQLR